MKITKNYLRKVIQQETQRLFEDMNMSMPDDQPAMSMPEPTPPVKLNPTQAEIVKKIQELLGFPTEEQDGIYGSETSKAVRTFFKNNIQVDRPAFKTFDEKIKYELDALLNNSSMPRSSSMPKPLTTDQQINLDNILDPSVNMSRLNPKPKVQSRLEEAIKNKVKDLLKKKVKNLN